MRALKHRAKNIPISMEGQAWCDRECSSSSEEDSHSDWSSGSVKSELDRGSPPIARCLLCPFESDDEDGTCVVLEHMIASHDLQLRQIGQPHWYPKSLNLLPPLSDYTRIALINVLRRKYIDQFSRGTPKDVAYRAVEDFLANLTATADVFTKPEDFLEPALSDDPLLYCGFTGWEDGLEEPSSAPALRPPVEAQDSEAFVAALSKGLDAAASNDAPADFFAEAGGEETQSDEEASDGVSTEGAKKRGGRQFSRVDQAYFAGYSELRIHREMVLDESRTKAYKDFMDKNKGAALALRSGLESRFEWASLATASSVGERGFLALSCPLKRRASAWRGDLLRLLSRSRRFGRRLRVRSAESLRGQGWRQEGSYISYAFHRVTSQTWSRSRVLVRKKPRGGSCSRTGRGARRVKGHRSCSQKNSPLERRTKRRASH